MSRSTRIRALARHVDEPRADDLAGRLAPRLREGSEAHSLATLLATAYPALAGTLLGEPQIANGLVEEGYRVPRDKDTLFARFAARGLARDAAPGTLADEPELFRRELRRAARDERIRIALRETLPPSLGGADVDVTAAELAVLAEVTVELALAEAERAIGARLGLPRTARGEPGRFVVLGMGKLGGSELNAGSDVDLVYLYDSDEAVAEARDGSRSSANEVWSRVARRLTSTLEEPTADGFVWRVDLRLRPEGRTGPIVNSLAAAERYYESYGRLWERAALLRARPIAGDLGFGDDALRALAPFVWRRRVDPRVAVEMVDLVRRARAELSRGSERDVKHAWGGIREAEFFIQSLQLIWGGREARVRAPSTMIALRRLRATGYVTDREGRDIAEGYLALRRAEHGVQVATGLQTHVLPAEGPELERLARVLGFRDARAFQADLDGHRARIAALFTSLVPEGPPPVSRWAEAIAALDRNDREAFTVALGRARVLASVPDEAARLEQLGRDLFDLARHPERPLGPRARERYPALADTLLDAVTDAASPEQAAHYLKLFFARLALPGVYVRLLGDRPQAVRRFVEALGASAFIGDAVAGHPELGDLVLFDRELPTAELARREIAEALQEGLSDEEPFEACAGALRRAKARVTVRVGLALLAGELGTRAATATLSALADATLEAATRFVMGLSPAERVCGLVVLAMGKLGGNDIGYGSDLDVIFLFDPAAFSGDGDAADRASRHARRIIRLISMSHGAGPGYELDTRLRPSGNQGLLVTSIDAFARYHGQGDVAAEGEGPPRRAATWERLALLRARVCAGDPELGVQAIRIAERTAYDGAAQPAVLARELHHVRVRMERELGSERQGRYDLKFGRGGLTDVEFCVELLQMVHGADPRVRTTETLRAIFALARAGHLAPEHEEVLREGYIFLRELEERIRVVHADSAHLLEERAPGLPPLARRMGIRDRAGAAAAAELLARYRDVTERVRGVYHALVLTPAAGAGAA
jgi:glutamate-ammonia-ligase adenylyltransferase